jgi:hypothetical protein
MPGSAFVGPAGLPPWAALGGAGVACRQLITDAHALAEVDVDAGPPRCRSVTRHAALLTSATRPRPVPTSSGEPTGAVTHVMAYAAGFALPALRNSLLPQLGQSFSVDTLLRSV